MKTAILGALVGVGGALVLSRWLTGALKEKVQADLPTPPSPAPDVAPSVRQPVNFQRDGAFPGLPVGTRISRVGHPGESWRVLTSYAPGTHPKGFGLSEWLYDVIQDALFASPSGYPVGEHEIEAVLT